MAMAESKSGERKYIYCIRLPFQCRSIENRSLVAKVGITENPAERFYNIFHAFEEFGQAQPLLKNLPESGVNPVEWAKSIDDVIFIHEVRDPETAEKNIRAQLVRTSVAEFYQPELENDFLDSFAAKVPKEKEDYLKSVGKTEWIILDHSLAMHLQGKFRSGRIVLASRRTPSGVDLSRGLRDCCVQFSRGKAPSRGMLIAGGVNQGLSVSFEFQALKFEHLLSTRPVPIQRSDPDVVD